jgi:hypothetical protein
MAPKRQRDEPDETISSPDPLAISGQNNEPIFRTPSRRGSTSPLKAQLQFDHSAIRATSPQKTVLLDPIPQSGMTSPWRIRVTVQAEPKDEEEQSPEVNIRESPSRAVSKRVKTMIVPLKDPDEEVKTPRRGRGRPRKSGTPAIRRPPTPARKIFGHDYDLEYDPDFNPSIGLKFDGAAQLSPRRQRGRLRRSTTPSAAPVENEENRQHIASTEHDSLPEPSRTRTTRSMSKEPAVQQPTINTTTQNVRQEAISKQDSTPPVRTLSPRRTTPAAEKWSKFSTLPPRASVDTVSKMTSDELLDDRLEPGEDEEEEDDDDEDEETSDKEISPDHLNNKIYEDLNGVQSGDQENNEILEDEDEGALESIDYDLNDDNIGDVNEDEVIGEETMMKSMDMTIVSPRSLYSKLDIDSSHLDAPKNEEPSSPIPSQQSSPHVKFSSPLVAPTPDNIRRNSRAHSASRDLEPPSRPSLKSSARSLSPAIQTHVPFKHLPTPDSDDKVSDDEKSARVPMKESTKEREARWQKEREQITFQAREAHPSTTVIIEDDESNQSEVDDDIWQEAANQSSSSLQHESSYISNRPSIATYREAKQSRNNEIKLTRANSNISSEQEEAIIEEPEHKETGSSEISMLFNAFAANRSSSSGGNVKEDQNERSPDTSREDLSAFLRRKVSNMMDAVDFSFTTPSRKKRSDDSHQLARSQNIRTESTTVPVNFGSSVLDDEPLPSIPTYSPKRSSPLKHRLHVDDGDSKSDDSSMLSDVRQLHEENRPVKRQALDSDVSFRSFQLSRPPRKSLLQLTQVRQAREYVRPSTDTLSTLEQESTTQGDISLQDVSVSEDIEDDPIRSGILSRIWSYVSEPSTAVNQPIPPSPQRFPPVRPSHPILKHFRLLPRNHPWTDNHFQSLLALYKHWQTHTYMYSPMHAHNAALITVDWCKYIDMEFCNWGYDMQLSESLVVLAAIFYQLLVLEDAAEYKEMYGHDMEMGFVAQRTVNAGPITEWHVALRLFTLAVGDVVRNEEKSGRGIDRSPALKWRFKGQWIWKRGWYWGLF